MAEKKFSGAPFGTQTARFDVTGVHPNKKIPGTFTQIPYDKPSTMELQSVGLLLIPSEKWVKMDDHWMNTRELFGHLQKPVCSQTSTCNKKIVQKYDDLTLNKHYGAPVKKAIALPIQSSGTKKMFNLEIELLNNNIDMLENNNISNNNSATEHSALGESDQREEDSGVDKTFEVDLSTVYSSDDASQENRASRNAPLLQRTSKEEFASGDLEKLSSLGKMNEYKREKAASKILALVNQTPVQAISNETSRASIKALIALHTSDKRSPAASAETLKVEKTSAFKPSGSVTKATMTQGRKLPSGSSNLKVKELHLIEKNVDASPRQTLWEIQEETCDSFLRRKLGPGAYNTCIGGFSVKSVENKASGPGWARQLEVERLASLPHLLYKEQWEENKMLKRKLGPGSYDIKDFIQMSNEKPRSGRGICDKLAPRFEKAHSSVTPGPGTYGIGGVPQRAIEDKDGQSTSTKGMLDKGDRKRTLPSVGSHLGPGTYRHKTCTDELLNKVTSLKGPYRLYSGDRNKPISEGYLAAPQLADLGPGQYEIGSFVDDLHNKERRTHGKFGKMAQYPEVPTDRLFLFSQAHCNRKGIPGPGAYSMQELSKPTAVNSPGFLSSAKRDDKISQKFFTRNFNPVGAGRYDIQKFEEAQDVNGHNSVFRSKTGKPNLQMAKFLQERIRAKDVSVENRVVLCQPTKMTRSLTVM